MTRRMSCRRPTCARSSISTDSAVPRAARVVPGCSRSCATRRTPGGTSIAPTRSRPSSMRSYTAKPWRTSIRKRCCSGRRRAHRCGTRSTGCRANSARSSCCESSRGCPTRKSATWRGGRVAAPSRGPRRRRTLQRAAGGALTDQVLASHVRSLMPGHLTDVVSADQHTVKPWFNGKLDFSPPVYDFAGRGFPLIGGRLDYVSGRAVAALVYGRRQHLINVFLWPAVRGPAGGPPAVTRQGYHLLHWTTPEYAYWVVSDLGIAELRDFAALVARGDSAAATPARSAPAPP